MGGKKPFGFESEFNAGQLDFMRFDTILRKADEMQCQSVLFSRGAIVQYYAAVRSLFNNLKPLLVQNKKMKIVAQYEEVLDIIYSKVMDWNTLKNKPFPTTLYKAIETVHGDLLYLRQMIGIGIPMMRKFAEKTKIRKGLNVSKIKIQ